MWLIMCSCRLCRVLVTMGTNLVTSSILRALGVLLRDRLLALVTFTVMCTPRLSISLVPPPVWTTTGCRFLVATVPSPQFRVVAAPRFATLPLHWCT